MANEQDQLVYQLSHINIGSLDDSLSKQLNNTHLSDKLTTSHTSTNHVTNEPRTPWPSAVPNHLTTDTPSWQITTQSPLPPNADDQDDWGEAPAYTSILPFTEFGYTSTIIPSLAPIPSSSNMKKDTLALDPNQPFNRYSQQPNAFASFASPHPSNNASHF